MLYESAYFSLIIQFIVGLINIYGLNIDVSNNKKIIKDILKLELGVQIIEFIFYTWMIMNFQLIKNITPYRYLDWIITTPTMLITLISYLNNKDNSSLKEFLNKNKFFVSKIIILNTIMMLFGLAGELNYMDYNTAIIIGFIPFVYYFKIIYDKYLITNTENDKLNTEDDKPNTENDNTNIENDNTNIENDNTNIENDNTNTESDKTKLYWFFLIIWTIYGVVAFLPYEQKNTAYNILDLFSKNLFSVFLVIIILKSSNSL
jgi:bacteriorhodopsin